MLKKYGIQKQMHLSPLLSSLLNKIYEGYSRSLLFFLGHRYLQIFTISITILSILFSSLYILPRLKNEIIGVPETPIMGVGIYVPSNSEYEKLEKIAEDFSNLMKEELPEKIGFIFSNIYSSNNAFLAVHLNDKKQYKEISSRLEELTKDIDGVFYNFFPFNPSELKIPYPPDWKIEFSGNDISKIKEAIEYFYYDLKDSEILENIRIDLDSFDNRNSEYKFIVKEHLKRNSDINYQDISTIISLANKEQEIGRISIDNKQKEILVLFPDSLRNDFTKLINMPIAFGEYIIPVRSLMDIVEVEPKSSIIRVGNEN
jgi:multidrug efflux pump subunit AcrB